ncbi:Two-component response regulator, SAPR family, consists of REC, wHTH and BTAD domains [Tindallia magadiensis]|uniref:Stage 0 sporulation protein A homolog n=1 Tax=Tindallia magadiensis TaxID=69895 RepID=A0A1I3E2E0_9FIRM|nr:response regulator [Tindallia magadiensis]SFH92998.1 Two-component response regulator, SAPR family, consists of REC, wHTH and BTAD domains [Tindallia magadiensis]
MLKVIAIDDEPMALKRFARIIKEMNNVELIKTFENPSEALVFLEKNPVDIAYVDIEMPSISGIELAEKLTSVCPSLDVVMVTAHDQYALEAFRVYAAGYLLKPVERKEVEKCTNMIEKRRNTGKSLPEKEKLYVRCFGDFFCYSNGEMPRYFKWRTAKTRELMAILNHFKGQPVHRDQLLDWLWPEKDIKRAVQNFHATSYYLRNQLEKNGFKHVFEQKNGQYHLNMKYIDSDLCKMDKIIDKIKNEEQKTEDYLALVQLYKGHYFEKQGYLWALDSQEGYRQTFESVQMRLHHYYVQKNERQKAEKALKDIIEIDQLNEEAYGMLITFYLNQKNHVMAIKIYEMMYRLFQEELGIEPPPQITKMFNGVTLTP